uniref:Uncharacterized protein n=1 Tax=viral metagenome TaxID=1070528 RepID=A0A6M3XW58_9ZZZZ
MKTDREIRLEKALQHYSATLRDINCYATPEEMKDKINRIADNICNATLQK